jgi:Holliday junction resolvase
VALETFDGGLQTLGQYLEGKGKNPGQYFEAAIADLLTLLGFQVLHLSGSNRSKAPDLVARVPSTGDLVLIECTTDTLKGDNKLGKLFARVAEVKEKLFANSLGNTRVLPVIVTSLPLHQIEADVPEAERLGIVVVHQGDIREGIRRTVLANDPSQLFEEAFKGMLSVKGEKSA